LTLSTNFNPKVNILDNISFSEYSTHYDDVVKEAVAKADI
jgi:hypothetical protein